MINKGVMVALLVVTLFAGILLGVLIVVEPAAHQSIPVSVPADLQVIWCDSKADGVDEVTAALTMGVVFDLTIEQIPEAVNMLKYGWSLCD